MKKTKKITILSTVLVIVFALSACEGADQGENNPYGDTFTIEENDPFDGAFTIEDIQGNPSSYSGEITLIGIVGTSSTQDFSLQTSSGTFEVFVDYRGSQALPSLGDRVAVEGRLSQNRPCCGPGYTIVSTRFEGVQ